MITDFASSWLSLLPLVAEVPQSNGIALAAFIGIAMLIALVFSAWKISQAFSEVAMPEPPAWLKLAIPILALLGLGVAIYLTYIEGTSALAICGPIGDCNAVQKSPYAKVLGVIPVGLIGALGYLAILFVWWMGRRAVGKKSFFDQLSAYSPVILWGMAVFGTIYSIYLTYLEIFVIRAVCIWCLASAVIMTLIMLAALPACTRWLVGAEEA